MDWIEKMDNLVLLLSRVDSGLWYHDYHNCPWDITVWDMDATCEEKEFVANIGGRVIAICEEEDGERNIADFVVACRNELGWIFESIKNKLAGEEIKRSEYIFNIMCNLKHGYYDKFGNDLEYNNDIKRENIDEMDGYFIWVGPPLNRKYEGNIDCWKYEKENEDVKRAGLVDFGSAKATEFITACFCDLPEIIEAIIFLIKGEKRKISGRIEE